MNKVISIVVLVLAIAAILFGGFGLLGLARTAWHSGIEPDRIPRYVFTFALCALFILIGIKAIGFAQRKSAQSCGAAEAPRAGKLANSGTPTAFRDELDVTWSRATQIWWSVTWRSVVVSMLAGLIAGIFAGAILEVIGRNDLAIPLGNIVGIVVAVPAGIWAIKTVLGKEYRHYRVALVASTEAQLESVLDRRHL